MRPMRSSPIRADRLPVGVHRADLTFRQSISALYTAQMQKRVAVERVAENPLRAHNQPWNKDLWVG